MITFNCDLSTRHSAAKVPQKKKENGEKKNFFALVRRPYTVTFWRQIDNSKSLSFFPLTKIFIQVDDDKERENLSGRFVSCFS